MKSRGFAIFAWCVLAYTVLVILWGAYVRATGSGAGCGSHWPLCNGDVVPRATQIETVVEYAHRISSALSVALIGGLLVWGFRLFGRGHPTRKSLVAAGVFILLEALIGAGLVLLGLTADNDSVARAVSMALHLVNTFLLMAVLALTAWTASGGGVSHFRGPGWVRVAWWAGLGFLIVLGMSGAVTALGDTLFPSESLVEGMRADFSPTAHFLVRMRVWHPAIAVATGLYIVSLSRALALRHPGRLTGHLAYLQVGLFVVQLMAGALNVALLAPVWMQLLHLALAVSVWLALVVLGASAFSVDAAGRVLQPRPAPRNAA